MWVPEKPGRGVGVLCAGVTGGCLSWLLEVRPYPLQGQQVLLTAEPSPETLNLILYFSGSLRGSLKLLIWAGQ